VNGKTAPLLKPLGGEIKHAAFQRKFINAYDLRTFIKQMRERTEAPCGEGADVPERNRQMPLGRAAVPGTGWE
jgi:hypothetical protein